MAKHRRAAESRRRNLAISLGISALFLAIGLWRIEGLTAAHLGDRLLWPLTRLMLFITVGLAVGQIVEAAGWTRALSVVARPLFRFGNLGNRCSAAFTTAFFSGVAANAMLLEFYQEGKISRAQLFLTNFVNQLPAYFLHLPTTFFIVIPLTGWAGALYFLLTFLATVIRTVGFLLFGHLRPDLSLKDDGEAVTGRTGRPRHSTPGPQSSVLSPQSSALWAGVRRKLPGRVMNIAVYVVPIYIFVFLINAAGFFKAAQTLLSDWVVTAFMPVEALSMVILSFAAEFTSGFAAAGALMDAGVLTTKQTVLALLIGNVVAFPIRAIRHQLPRYMGIFSPKMGAQILLMGQGFRVASIIAVGVGFYLMG